MYLCEDEAQEKLSELISIVERIFETYRNQVGTLSIELGYNHQYLGEKLCHCRGRYPVFLIVDDEQK